MKILKCSSCKKYTLKKICPYCKAKTVEVKPAKFSFMDKYSYYRRILKKKGEEYE